MDSYFPCSRIQVFSNNEFSLILPKQGQCQINVCKNIIGTIILKVFKSKEIFGQNNKEEIITFKVEKADYFLFNSL
jgi:hypothetical protein